MAEDTPAPGGARPRPEQPADSHPSGADVGWGITGTMLSGIVVWGGAGWALDRWLDTRFFVLIGVLLGLGVAIYLVVVKYAPPLPPSGKTPTGTTRDGRRGRSRPQKGQR